MSENIETQVKISIFGVDEYDIDFSQNLVDLTTACWNNFPHKELGGKCPEELFF